jgi:hypothetical protein
VDWTSRPEPGIRYYAGRATYRKTFELAGPPAPGPTYLDLGQVNGLAAVRLNGRDLGVVWTAPWRVDVAGAIRAGTNRLDIDVYTPWANRLTGDAALPPEQQHTWLAWRGAISKDARLLPSGLIGPVRLLGGA